MESWHPSCRVRRMLRSPATPPLTLVGPIDQVAFPILNIVVPHSPQVPRVAGRQFFIVTGWAFRISRLSRHFRQYPVIESSLSFLKSHTHAVAFASSGQGGSYHWDVCLARPGPPRGQRTLPPLCPIAEVSDRHVFRENSADCVTPCDAEVPNERAGNVGREFHRRRSDTILCSILVNWGRHTHRGGMKGSTHPDPGAHQSG